MGVHDSTEAASPGSYGRREELLLHLLLLLLQQQQQQALQQQQHALNRQLWGAFDRTFPALLLLLLLLQRLVSSFVV